MIRAMTRQWSPFTRSFAALGGAHLTAQAIRLLYIILVGRLLGPEQLGVYMYGLAVYLALFALSTFGQRLFLSVRIGGRSGKARLVGSQSLVIRLSATALAVAAGGAYLWLFEDRAQVMQVAAIFMIALVARSIAYWVRDFHIALERTSWIPRYELCFRGAEALIGLALLWLGFGLLAICVLHSVMWGIEAGFSLRRLLVHTRLRLRFRTLRHLLPGYVGTSAVFLFAIGTLNLFPKAGILVLGQTEDDLAAAGLLSIAMQFLTAIILFATMFGSAAVPAIGRSMRLNRAALASGMIPIVKVILLAGTLLALVLEAYAAPLISLAMGADFSLAAQTFGWVIWAVGPYAIVVVLVQALHALSEWRTTSLIPLAMVVLQVALLLALMSIGPLEAAAVSIVVASCMGCIVAVRTLTPHMNVAGNGWWFRPFATLIAAGGLMQLIPLPAMVLAPAIAVGVVLSAWRLNMLDAQDMAAILSRVGLRRRTSSNVSSEGRCQSAVQGVGNP